MACSLTLIFVYRLLLTIQTAVAVFLHLIPIITVLRLNSSRLSADVNVL